MDRHRFDVLTRSVGGAPTRRNVLRSIAGAALGFGALRLPDAAAAKRKKKRKKREPALRCDVCRRGCAFTSVQAAIDAAAPEATIRLCPETYREHVYVEKNLTLLGAGADRTVLDGGGAASPAAVLHVYEAIVEVRALTVRGGNSATGGGIDNEGALSLYGVHVTGNAADEGAGIFTHPGAELRLVDSRVSGNNADDDGGGLWVDGGAVTLTRTRVTGNKAVNGGFGGGIHVYDGTVTHNGSQVTGNEATGAGSQGGGFYVFRGDLVLNGTPVTGNTAAAGGGIYNSDGAVSVALGSVTGNTPNNCAGEAVINCAN